MRMRHVAALVSLLLPAVAAAQRFPQPGVLRPKPRDPTELPRQPEPIARAAAYQRLNISFETYPLLSYIQTSGFTGVISSTWTTLGAGTRAEYRLTRFTSASLDFTSSFLGGAVNVTTAELGTRIRPSGEVQRLNPFIDLRLGYVAANSGPLMSTLDNAFPFNGGSSVYSARYSAGWGGIVGGGAEYELGRSFTLTTALLATRSWLSTHDLQSQAVTPNFTLTSMRYTLGLKYTPIREILR